MDHCSHRRYTLLPFVGFLFWELSTFHWYFRQTHHVWSYFKRVAGPFLPFDIHLEFPLFQVCFCMCVVHRDGIAANRESYTSPVTDAELAGRLQWGDVPWEKLIQFRAEFLDLGWVWLQSISVSTVLHKKVVWYSWKSWIVTRLQLRRSKSFLNKCCILSFGDQTNPSSHKLLQPLAKELTLHFMGHASRTSSFSSFDCVG